MFSISEFWAFRNKNAIHPHCEYYSKKWVICENNSLDIAIIIELDVFFFIRYSAHFSPKKDIILHWSTSK